MNESKEKIEHIVCQNHTASYEKDLYRSCPSKLNKKELENVYFVLLDSNIQQKKTINSLREQVKVLNTKIHRISAQKTIFSNKNCCSSSKGIINEQKELIADQQRANERLSDRIKILNMRLCSAKQFLRRPQSASACTKCFSSNPSIKNVSRSNLNTKRSEINLQIAANSCQIVNREENTVNKLVQNTSTQVSMLFEDKDCEHNKCRDATEELEVKIFNLEQELLNKQKQYSDSVSKLEDEVNTLRSDSVRLRAEHSRSFEKFQVNYRDNVELLRKLRTTEAQCDEVKAQLIIEKSRVLELETQLKASDISGHLAKTLEVHMKKNMLLLSNNSVSTSMEFKDKFNMASDDSGYTDVNKSLDFSTKNVTKDGALSSHVRHLQAQIDSIKYTIEQNSSSDDKHITSNEYDQSAPSQISNEVLQLLTKYVKSCDSGKVTSNSVSKIPLPIKQSHNLNLDKSDTTNECCEVKVANEKDNDTFIKKITDNNDTNDHSESNDAIDSVKENKLEANEISTKDSLEDVKDIPVACILSNVDIEATEGNVKRNNATDKTETTVNEINDNNDVNDEIDILTSKYESNFDGTNSNEDAGKSSGHSTFIVATKKSKKAIMKYKKENQELRPTATSSPHRTYNVHREHKVTSLSNNTESEISSLTDLPNESYDKSPRDDISPGEERFTGAPSSCCTTTDCGSLSDGEIPPGRADKLSMGRVVLKNESTESVGQSTKYKMEEALHEVGVELKRCRDMLYSGRNVSGSSSNINDVRFCYPYTFTLPLL